MLHVVASPPQGWHWTNERFWDARSSAYDAAGDAGVRGGVCIPHPYRPTDAGDELFETAVEHGDWSEDRGKWALFRDAADGDWSAFLEHAEGAPHYHMLAAAEWLESDDAPAGWVVKNMRSMGTFHVDDVESYRPMAATAFYTLTHAGAQVGRQTVTYFGDVHPASFNPEEELDPHVWAKIQRNAERALSAAPGGASRAQGVDAIVCPRDGCESDVVALEELSDWMDDEDWFSGLGGRERNQLRALEVWVVLQVDRPPPRRRTSRESVLRWLEQRGAVLTDADRDPMGVGTVPAGLAEFGAGY